VLARSMALELIELARNLVRGRGQHD
jgi:hypothetical protein